MYFPDPDGIEVQVAGVVKAVGTEPARCRSRLSAVSEVVADRMSTGDRIIEEGETIIVVPASAPQPCVLEAFGKEQTGIGP